jgi:two-component system chemotaxis response regulator CheY
MARILVIDDDELIRGTVQTILASEGHDAVLAVDGEDGIRQFQRQQFDLVLCDVFMPRKEGLETVREIRQLSAGTPIISMTGSIPASDGGGLDPDFLRMSGMLGATRTIAKPFRPRELLTLVRACLGPAGEGGGR